MTDTLSNPSLVPGETDLFTVAHDLLRQANEQRQLGNDAAAAKLLKAAGNIMGEEITVDAKAPPPNGTQQVAEILRKGWKEVSEIMAETNMTANRIHVIIGRLKGKGQGLESQTVKRYRIVGK